MEKNLTTGNVALNLIKFSLPFLFAYFLQTFYGMADLFFIGLLNVTAFSSAVTIGSQIMHVLTVIIVGLAAGSTVVIGKAVGGNDAEMKNRAVGNTAVIFIIVSVILTVILILLRSQIVSVMSTPAEAVDGTTDYITICFLGIPFITAYNVISSVFRGMGDSKTPLYFVLISCVLNIGLDCLFIFAFNMGPSGAALGTTLSQASAVVIAVLVIWKRKLISGLGKDHFRPDRKIISEVFKVGGPIAAQDGFIQLSFIIITIIANGRGLTDSAAVGIVEKLIGILFLVNSTLLNTVSALCAQNIGAGKLERANSTLHYAILISVSFGFVCAAVIQFIPGVFLRIFTADEAVISLGSGYLMSYSTDCFIAAVHFMYSGYFAARKKSYLSFIHNVISSFCVRIPLCFILSEAYPSTLLPMGFAAPAGSLISIIICLIAMAVLNNKDKKELGKTTTLAV